MAVQEPAALHRHRDRRLHDRYGTAPGATVTNSGTRNDKVAFFNDVQRGYRQTAFFASADFDIIPHVLTVTGGTRWYRFVNDERGDATSSFGCYEAGPAPCLAGATDIDALGLHTQYKGFKSRANISWHFMPEALVYFTWSQGFRPGAFNRTVGCWIPNANGVAQYCQPTAYASDNLTNNEIGWKTEFFDHRLQFNGAVYRENWSNVQINLFDPPTLGNVGFATNGPTYRVQGIETSFIAVIAKGLTAQGSAAWNHSEQTNSPQLFVNNPALAGDPSFGKVISNVNPYGNVGSPSANSPPIQFNFRLRYEFTVNDIRVSRNSARRTPGIRSLKRAAIRRYPWVRSSAPRACVSKIRPTPSSTYRPASPRTSGRRSFTSRT